MVALIQHRIGSWIKNAMNAQQIDITLDNKVSEEIVCSSNKGRQHNKHMEDEKCETNIQMQYQRIRKPNRLPYQS